MRLLCLVGMLVLLAGCSSLKKFGFLESEKPAVKTTLERERVQARVNDAAQAAVAKVGAPVCRKFSVDDSGDEWVQGKVVEARGIIVRVEIEEPGNYPHQLNGAAIARGALVWDEAVSWTPCVK